MPNLAKPATPSAQQRPSCLVVAHLAVPVLQNPRRHVAGQSEPDATQASHKTEVSLWSQLNLGGAKPQHGLLESFHLSSSQAPAWVSRHA
jgi:hypothetical protein